ncbi:MAG: deoxyribose-phosphate aldolase [Thermoanaerobaculia bacterium]|nr:MAG: deoxyribose-phosphate aldolase [Thermoanaerobaculia bacterium]MBZ0100772.1 deoxyribose-phosphate aldolase [Thermoanaerobaculia bacterium]
MTTLELPLRLPDLSRVPRVDAVGIEERAAALAKRSIKKGAKQTGIRLAISMIDLTTLEGKDSEGKVLQMCQKALHPLPGDPTVGPVAAVCVYPNLVAVARRALAGSPVRVASVATGFPSGLVPLDLKLEETRRAVAEGADEIDMVIDRGAFLSGEYAAVFDEIARVREACGPAHLKVILETGELLTFDHVRRAAELAMAAGADFIKTSTGKIQPAATPGVVLVMLEAIRDFYLATGRRIGMKPAGGIRTSKQALHLLVMVKETLGDAWLTPDLFRIGASTLTNDLLQQLVKEATGRYQSEDYFSKD